MKKTMENWFDEFNKCETEEDLRKFYMDYWQLVEDTIIKVRKIDLGEKKAIAETYERVRSNLLYLLGNVNEMRADFARKIWWFL